MRSSEPYSPATYAIAASLLTKRQIVSELRIARFELAHHGRHSFMGKIARRKIAAYEGELRKRGLPVPEATL